MRTVRVARFNGCLQALGIVVALVGATLLLFGSAIFGIATTSKKPAPPAPPAVSVTIPGETPVQKLARLQNEQARREKMAGDIDTAVRGTVGFGGFVAGGFGLLALLGGGSLLWRKSVWRCGNCGAFIDRI